jgi:hypothetical protein
MVVASLHIGKASGSEFHENCSLLFQCFEDDTNQPQSTAYMQEKNERNLNAMVCAWLLFSTKKQAGHIERTLLEENAKNGEWRES